MKAGLLQE